MSNVILFNAVFNIKKIAEPLGCASLAAVLRSKGITEIEIYEPRLNGDSVETVVDYIYQKNPKIIGISLIPLYRNVVEECSKFVKKIREKHYNGKIVIGGHSPSIDPEAFMFEGVDVVFMGEAELNFPEFVKRVLNGKEFNDVLGIAYRLGDKMVVNPPPDRVENLDELPFFARDILKLNVQKYGRDIIAQLIGSRGCYQNCSYCSIKSFTKLQKGKIYRERSVENIVQEMKEINNLYGVRKFMFEDDNFMPCQQEMALEKVRNFCDLLTAYNLNNIELNMQFRPDNINIECVALLKQHGLKSFSMGMESINKEELLMYRREMDVDIVLSNIEQIKDLGFSGDINSPYRMKLGYIFFNPYSTRESLLKSVKFIKENKITPKSLRTRLFLYPNTDIFKKIKEDGLLKKIDASVDLQDNEYITSDYTFSFLNKDVEVIFSNFMESIFYILKYRERIRLVKKYERELNKNTDYFIALDEIRIWLDELCFDTIEKMLIADAVDIEKIKSDCIACVDNKIRDNNINDRIKKFEESFGVQVEIFR